MAHYLISSALSSKRFNEIVRSHRGVENGLHWRSDVVMKEDQDRTGQDNGPHSLAALRHMAINVVQTAKSKESLHARLMRAAWDDRYLARLLAMF